MSHAHRLVIDRIACTGHGLCAELFPEQLALDEWGYPIQQAAPIAGAQLKHAKRAVAACPVLALRLETVRTQHDPTRPPNHVRTHP